jgi:hypothetical protein
LEQIRRCALPDLASGRPTADTDARLRREVGRNRHDIGKPTAAADRVMAPIRSGVARGPGIPQRAECGFRRKAVPAEGATITAGVWPTWPVVRATRWF